MRWNIKQIRGLALAGIVSLSVLILATVPAAALCGTRADVIRFLAAAYQEERAGVGLSGDGKHLAELFISKTGSWTMIVTSPKGSSCVIATGKHWHDLTEKPAASLTGEKY